MNSPINPALKNDIVSILTARVEGQTNWENAETGEKIFADSLSSVVDRLREKGWRNISDLCASDFKDAGFRVLEQSAYRNAPPSPWVEDRGYRKSRLGKGRTLISLAA